MAQRLFASALRTVVPVEARPAVPHGWFYDDSFGPGARFVHAADGWATTTSRPLLNSSFGPGAIYQFADEMGALGASYRPYVAAPGESFIRFAAPDSRGFHMASGSAMDAQAIFPTLGVPNYYSNLPVQSWTAPGYTQLMQSTVAPANGSSGMGLQYFQAGSFTLTPTGYSAGGSFGFGTIQYAPSTPTPFNLLAK